MGTQLKTSEIINQILFELKMNPNQFAKSINAAASQIYDFQTEKVRTITPDMADKIRSVHPQYSRSWLLSGEGDAHVPSPLQKETIIQDDNTPTLSGDVVSMFNSLINEMSKQRETYAEQMNKHIDLLEHTIKQVDELIYAINNKNQAL